MKKEDHMDINNKTTALIQGLSQLISTSGLPPCVVGLVLDKLRSQVETLEAEAILAERKAQEGAKVKAAAESADLQEGQV